MNHSHVTRDQLLTTLAKRIVLVSSLVAGAWGCDSAKSDYEKCMELEAKWKMVEARDACKAAVAADPDSKSGKAAQAKLDYLEKEAEKALKEQAKKSGICKAQKWVTRCMWKGKPRPSLVESSSKASCDQEAHQMSVIGMTCPACVCKDYWEEPYEDM